jgi:hypothetical protein
LFCFIISCITFSIKDMSNHYAAFRSDSLSTNEERRYMIFLYNAKTECCEQGKWVSGAYKAFIKGTMNCLMSDSGLERAE